MARLKIVSPGVALPTLDRARFDELTAPVADWTAKTIEWSSLLQSYRWNGDWKAGLAARERLANLLGSAATRQDLTSAMSEIVAWGGLRPLGARLTDEVARSLGILDALATSGAAPPSNLCGERVAAVSKIYAMHDTRRWVIYDSRVAWALAALMHDCSSAASPPPVQFPQPSGRSGDPFRGVPTLSSSRQGAMAFVYASWLCQSIAQRIVGPCPDHHGWRTVHVEMALFTLGSPKTRKDKAMPSPKKAAVKESGNIPLSPSAAAVEVGRQLLQSEIVRHTAQRHVLTRLERFQAKGQATRFADQADCEVALLQFPDGPERWTVFKDGEPILAFPVYEGDLVNALQFHQVDRIKMRKPAELASELEREKKARRDRLRVWSKKTAGESPVQELDPTELEDDL